MLCDETMAGLQSVTQIVTINSRLFNDFIDFSQKCNISVNYNSKLFETFGVNCGKTYAAYIKRILSSDFQFMLLNGYIDGVVVIFMINKSFKEIWLILQFNTHQLLLLYLLDL